MKIKKRFAVPAALALIYLLGPRASYPDFDGKIQDLDLGIEDLTAFTEKKYADTLNLKPGNEGYIQWAGAAGEKTEYSVVYLHGFSASPMEGDPIHREFAARYGANLYVPLLAGHGVSDKESFENLTPKDLVESAKEAIAVGNLLGEKLIILSCSTGSTLSIYLAAENPERVHAQMCYSPNIDLEDKTSVLLTRPWGLKLAQTVTGKKYRHVPLPERCHPYWTMDYRLEGIIALRALLDQTMRPDIFRKIDSPLYIGYYYKNEDQRDKTVSIEAMKDFYEQVKTPDELKRIQAYPEGTHVMLSPLQNPDITRVRTETFKFAEEILKLKPQEKKETVKEISVVKEEEGFGSE